MVEVTHGMPSVARWLIGMRVASTLVDLNRGWAVAEAHVTMTSHESDVTC